MPLYFYFTSLLLLLLCLFQKISRHLLQFICMCECVCTRVCIFQRAYCLRERKHIHINYVLRVRPQHNKNQMRKRQWHRIDKQKKPNGMTRYERGKNGKDDKLMWKLEKLLFFLAMSWNISMCLTNDFFAPSLYFLMTLICYTFFTCVNGAQFSLYHTRTHTFTRSHIHAYAWSFAVGFFCIKIKFHIT